MPNPLPNVSDEERSQLRDMLRRYLDNQWPAASAMARSADPQGQGRLWQGLAELGLTRLGFDRAEGGLREVAVAMEELGRAAAAAPLLAACTANLLCERHAHLRTSLQAALGEVHAGQARWALALSSLTPGLALTLHAGLAHGHLQWVDGAAGATQVLAVARHNGRLGLAVVALDGPAAQVLPARAMGLEAGAAWADIQLHGAAAQFIEVNPEALDQTLHILRVGLLARAYGAARRAFELTLEHAHHRHQFGQPIGRFQAVQHKLADNLIALEGVRLTLAQAASAPAALASYFSAAAFAFAGSALRQVTLHTQHVLGAVGYAEEHEAARHFRRVHLDTLPLGGAAQARGELAAHLLDSGAAGLPVYDLGPAGNDLREELRAWLATHWSGARKAAFDALPFHEREFCADFARDLGATGWLGLSWPRQHGGQARSAREQLAFLEEMERAEAPRAGAAVQAIALMLHGTPAQQQRYLPEILRGQVMHGMGYSEPEAGSDLAALRTRAVRDGEQWVITGQKIWTTTYWGQYMFLAARSDANAKPAQAGISMFIVPMDAPGITVRPAATLYDGRFANIFYDEVRIPLDHLVGPLNGGWKVLTDALAHERGLVGGGIVLKVAHAFELLCETIRQSTQDGRPLREDALVRDRMAQLAAEIEVGRQLMMHCAELAGGGATPPEIGAMSKVFSSELMERFGEAALEILGMRATLSQGAPGNLRNGRFEQGLRHSLMWVISIGTNEIQRSLIAQRGLGLPR